MAQNPTGTARHMWRLLEPLHAVTYFAPASIEAFKAAGLKGFWMGYFAGRGAPMGAVGPAVVEATFYNFAPHMVRRAVPDAWGLASPDRVLEARLDGVREVLGPLVASTSGAGALDRINEALEVALEGLVTDGRPLAAANAALAHPADPVARLWQAATTLREHRGDGHVACLVDAELDGLEAHITLVAAGHITRPVLQGARGWSDDEWTAAEDRLRHRGVIDDAGSLTTSGASLRQGLEDATDRLAGGPWRRLGEDRTRELAQALTPMTRAVAQAGIIPLSNPMGVPPA